MVEKTLRAKQGPTLEGSDICLQLRPETVTQICIFLFEVLVLILVGSSRFTSTSLLRCVKVVCNKHLLTHTQKRKKMFVLEFTLALQCFCTWSTRQKVNEHSRFRVRHCVVSFKIAKVRKLRENFLFFFVAKSEKIDLRSPITASS